MSDNTDIEFIDLDEKEEKEQENLKEKLKIISSKCVGTHVKFIDSSEFDCAKIVFKCGREFRNFDVASTSDADQVLSIDFFKYSFVDGYQAIVDYSSREIICSVQFSNQIYIMGPLFKILIGRSKSSSDEKILIAVSRNEDEDSPKIYFEPSPPSLRILGEVMSPAPSRYCLRLVNFSFTDHQSVLAIMKRFAEAFLFQIDLESGITPYLVRERKGTPRTRLKYKVNPSYEFPKCEYDEQPISLYTYAVNARQMPLLQFLAFYQVIEFYYPFHVQSEAKRLIRGTLKRADFRVDRDSDISHLINKLRPLIGDRFSKESEQLKYTLKECVDPDDLRNFITENPEMTEHFSKDKIIKSHKISVNSSDIISDMANRIYQIRCRIVHTKADDISSIEPILPYSKEEQSMGFEIDLIRYLARMVINSNGADITHHQ